MSFIKVKVIIAAPMSGSLSGTHYTSEHNHDKEVKTSINTQQICYYVPYNENTFLYMSNGDTLLIEGEFNLV